MLLLLPHLETRQVGVPQDEFVLVLKVLCYCAFNCLAVLLLQGEPEHQRIDVTMQSKEGQAGAVSAFSQYEQSVRTFDGWRVSWSHYTLGTFSSSAHSE